MPKVKHPENPSLPLFAPHSDWKPPTEPPNLSGVKLLGVDTETKDPGLTTFGPGFLHGKANVIGISLGTDDAKWYFPVGHPEDNCQWDVQGWLQDTLSVDRDYVGANLPYDVEALDSYGVKLGGRWLDVQVAEPLLDEERPGGYGLDPLAVAYLNAQKNEAVLRDAAAAFGIDPKKDLWKLPARYVGAYAEDDAQLAVRIYAKQVPLLEEQDLMRVFELETEILPIVWQMRKRGVRIDVEGAARLGEEWKARFDDLYTQISAGLGGLKVDIWSSKHLEQLCGARGLSFPRTEKGNPSFSNDWLSSHEFPVFNLIAEAREVEKMRRDFIEGSLLKYEIKGRLHAQFHTMRGDDTGTRSGRFSSTNPNLQQIPSRNPLYGPAIRALFLAEVDGLWYSGDYRSQEPRLTVHFANVLSARGAAEIVQRYRDNPLLDLHQVCADLCNTTKRHAKTINLGMTYGMGKAKLAAQLGLSMAEAEALFEVYHERFPFMQELSNIAMAAAERRGYVRTLLGRRSRFRMVEGRRQFTHKALNRIIQGSGADMNKKAILEVYKATGMIPLLTVHDENNYPVTDPDREAPILTEIMEGALPISVPIKIDAKVGANWAEAH